MKKFHLIGMGGIGMSGLAHLLLSSGAKVCGSDLSENALLSKIRSEGGEVHVGHSASLLNHPDGVVYSSSITPQNPELLLARNRGIPVLHRGQMLARLVGRSRTIAVTGAHGKSTTTAMAGELLLAAGLDPTVILGAEVAQLGGNARFGRGRYAVVEADESDGSLLWLAPQVAILTNVDEEHLDYFRNLGEILETYALFANRVAPDGALIGCADDRWVRRILSVSGRRTLTYGLSPEADFRADSIETGAGWSRYRAFLKNRFLGEVRLQIPGAHNVVNSLAVLALAHLFQIEWRVAKSALQQYRGAGRRFQILGEISGVMVVEDYGHHPTEIAATLAAARQWKERRILCIFQPHRFSRTKYLLQRFGQAFDSADEVILLPIYAASEEPNGVTSESLLEAIRTFGKVPAALEDPATLFEKLNGRCRAGDLLLFMGAGSIGAMSREFLASLQAPAVRPEPTAPLRQAQGERLSRRTTIAQDRIRNLQAKFLSACPDRVRFDEPMRLHTTFHIGGPAQVWAEPSDEKELKQLLAIARDAQLPVTVVGGGANLLVRDEGIPGLVLHLGSRGFQGCERSDGHLVAGAGLPIEWLIRRSSEERLSGVEFLAGVPGRVGGAIRMNAGTHDDEGKLHAMSDAVSSIRVMNLDGKVQELSPEEIGFRYRFSNLKDQIVLSARLALSPDKKEAIEERVSRLWAFKRRTQDWTGPSVGCIFKNPAPGQTAGWMIDQAGLKGHRIGQAVISPVHANFIMNLKGARAADVLALIEEAKARVLKRFGVALELEVKVLP